MQKPQVLTYSDWLVFETHRFRMSKSLLRVDESLELFQKYAKIGETTSFAKVFLQKQVALNESYNFILENESLLEAIQVQVALDLYKQELDANNGVVNEGWWDWAKSVFGGGIIDTVKAYIPQKVWDVADKLLDKGKEIWDKAVSGFKEFLAKAKKILSDILKMMKDFLSKIWDMIKQGGKMLVQSMMKSKMSKLQEIGDKLITSNEAEELESPDSVRVEVKQVSQETSEMLNKVFGGKGDQYQKAEKEGLEAIDHLKESEGIIWQSLVGAYSLSEAKGEDFFLFEEEGKEMSEEEKDQHRAAKWMQSIVQFILSPFGAITEWIAKHGTKLIMSVPSGVLKGFKNATKYSALPTVAALIAGIVVDSIAVGKGLSGHHESENFNGNETLIFESDGKLSTLFSQENIEKAGDSIVGVAAGGLMGFAFSIALNSVPAVKLAFEMISLLILVISFFGWLGTEKKQEWVPEFCNKFYHSMH